MNPTNTSVQNEAAAAAEHLLQIGLGYMPAMCLNIVTKLGVVDQLVNGPKPANDIAAAVGANADALYRVMRALSSVGIFHETAGRAFALTPASELLKSDHPSSMKSFVTFIADPMHFRCYANLMHSVKTGETTSEPTFGKPIFEYLQSDPDEAKVFNAAMVNLTQMFIPAILEAYDFSDTRTLVDVGGGYGSVLGSILQKYPHMKGILVDLAHVTEGAKPYLQSIGVADRCTIQSGDFFKSVPSGGDTYIMKHIIHDWDDERSATILRNIKQALGNNSGGKVLLLESVIGFGADLPMAKWGDIEMLALPGGRERTEEEFRQLFEKSGLRLNRIVPTQSPQCVIEAVLP
jgi:hypothetical protein